MLLDAAEARIDRIRMNAELASGFLNIEVGVGECPQCADKRAFGFQRPLRRMTEIQDGATDRTYSPPRCSIRLRNGSSANCMTRRLTLAKSKAIVAS